MPDHHRLSLWLGGFHIADVDEPSRFRYRVRFTPEALDHFGAGSTALSLSLPVSVRPITDRPPDQQVSAFLRGLLPEGAMLRQVSTALGVSTLDTIALLRGVGMECAGAIQCLPPGQAPTAGFVLPLTSEDVTRMVETLPTLAAPDGPLPHASLGGLQDKLLLTLMPDGNWGWPQAGAISTHILKPEPWRDAVVPHLVQAEQWTLAVADTAGLAVASSRLTTFGTRETLVVARYDRTPEGGRIHQEDFCQALGIPPEDKYESEFESTSRLRRIAALLAATTSDPSHTRRDLLRQVTFNTAIGNADAHSKNYSVLLSDQGQPSLAPLYDCAPLFLLDDRFRSAGQVINHRLRLDEITVNDLVDEARLWGMDEDEARTTIVTTLDQMTIATRNVPPPEPLPDLARRVAARITKLRT